MHFLWSLFFCLPYISLIAVILTSWLHLEEKERRAVSILTLCALLLHIVYVFLVHRMPVLKQGRFFFIDEYSYDRFSWAIAREWRSGNFPNLWTDQYLGTLHTGWNRIVAAVYYVSGHHPNIVIALNVMAGTLFVPLAFLTGRELFRTSDQESLKTDKEIIRKPAFIAALISAVHFSFAYWSSFLLRDIILAILFLAALYLILKLFEKWRFLQATALIFILLGLAILRVYSVAFLIAGPVVYLLSVHRKRKFAWFGLITAVFLVLAGRIFVPVRDYQDQIIYTFLNNLPGASKSPLGSLFSFLKGIPRFFLAPYAWYVSPGHPVIDYMLYPGMWIWYMIILPFSGKGLWICMKENRVKATLAVIPVMLSVFLFLLAYGGSVPRQRLFLEPLFIVFAAYGLSKKKSSNLLVWLWYIFLFFFIIAHSISAWQRGLW